jgi:hypothetical protein
VRVISLKTGKMRLVRAAWWARHVALVLVALTLALGLAHPAMAGFVPSGVSAADRAQDLEVMRRTLENRVVAERLSALGYSNHEIQQRVAALSDDELHRLASRVDSMAPGGSGLEAVAIILVVVILVLVILRLLGKRVEVDSAF